MDRKKTILIAVLINAGLLAILFIASLANQEEVSSSQMEISGTPLTTLEQPLFSDAADRVLQQPTQLSLAESQRTNEIAPAPQLNSVAVAPAPTAEEQILVHKLPPLVPEAIPASPVAAAAPSSQASHLEVTVKKGDSLEKIAKAHRTTADEIIKINHLPSSFLKVGQVLKLPAELAGKGALAKASLKPAPEKSAVAGNAEYYTVKVGDNPWTIAMKNHMKVEELLKLNSLNEERARKLKPGDRLRIR